MDKAEKEEFINKLSKLSREEINKLIQEKGKKAKRLRLFTRIKDTV